MGLSSSFAVIKTLNQVAYRAISVTFTNESGEFAAFVSNGGCKLSQKAPGFS